MVVGLAVLAWIAQVAGLPDNGVEFVAMLGVAGLCIALLAILVGLVGLAVARHGGR